MLKNSINITFLGFLFFPIFFYGQNDIASKEEMFAEQQQINFETFFYEALLQKGIDNFEKAIYALEACQDINPDDIAVLFEFSKNYYSLNKYDEAEYYGLQALQINPKNLYILRHLKEIKLKNNDYKGAIEFQKLIIAQKPNEEPDLIFIYIRAGDIQNAKSLMTKLDNENKLPKSFQAIKESLFQEKEAVVYANDNKEAFETRLDKLKKVYKGNNDYLTLKQILDRELKTKQYLLLLEDSKEAVIKYPSQPHVYIMNGVALNKLSKFKEAIEVLNIGLEFVIDNPLLESQFMEQLSLSYKGLSENKKASEYYNKMIQLRKN